MRVRNDWQRFSIATLLLFLVSGFAISPPEYHRSPSANSRSRVARAVRLDDHDLEHTLAAPELASDLGTSDRGDGSPAFEALFPPGPGSRVILPFAGYVLPDTFSSASHPSFSKYSGRAPPSC
jgi:hypothetical protein